MLRLSSSMDPSDETTEGYGLFGKHDVNASQLSGF